MGSAISWAQMVEEAASSQDDERSRQRPIILYLLQAIAPPESFRTKFKELLVKSVATVYIIKMKRIAVQQRPWWVLHESGVRPHCWPSWGLRPDWERWIVVFQQNNHFLDVFTKLETTGLLKERRIFYILKIWMKAWNIFYEAFIDVTNTYRQ